jgi:hypothetical protein
VEEMETAAGNFNKKIGKLGRDIKHWKVGSPKIDIDKHMDHNDSKKVVATLAGYSIA